MLRSRILGLGLCLALGALVACGSSPQPTFSPLDSGTSPGSGDGGGSSSGGPSPPGTITPPPPGNILTDAAAPDAGATDGGVTITTTIYAHTDKKLYSMNASTKAVTLLGSFAGMGTASNDSTVTDLAVNGAGDVYVNTESAVYKAALPATAPGTVQLTKVPGISTTGSAQKFFALAFTPAGALGAGETLVIGDGNGELWAVDPAGGATTDLGGFGDDPSIPGNILALSGDLVFYDDAAGKATGLATIRSCTPSTGTGAPKCTSKNDFLAGVDMAAMATAFTSGTPAKSLNGGIYGGSATSTGPGIGFGDVFGLGAWEGNVYGFTKSSSPQLVLIDATTNGGKGTAQGLGSITLDTGDNGWNGAGVTTKVQVIVGPPPPPPPPPK